MQFKVIYMMLVLTEVNNSNIVSIGIEWTLHFVHYDSISLTL